MLERQPTNSSTGASAQPPGPAAGISRPDLRGKGYDAQVALLTPDGGGSMAAADPGASKKPKGAATPSSPSKDKAPSQDAAKAKAPPSDPFKLSGSGAKDAAGFAREQYKGAKQQATKSHVTWLNTWTTTDAAAQVIALDPATGVMLGTSRSLPKKTRGQVVAEAVIDDLVLEQIELLTPAKANASKKGQSDSGFERVWVARSDLAIIPTPDDLYSSIESEVEAAANSAAAAENDPKTKKRKDAAVDLGNMKALDTDFAQRAGKLVDALVPNEGDSAKLTIRVNIPVGPGKLFFSLVGEAEKDNLIDDTQYKLRAEFAGGYAGGKKVWEVFEAFVEASVFGYIESSGDDGYEAIDLFVAALYDQVESVPKVGSAAAAAVFEGTEVASHIGSHMDREDYVEIGAGIRANAGLKWGKKAIGVGAEGGGGTRYQGKGAKGEEKGEVDEFGIYNFAAGFSAEAPVAGQGGQVAGQIKGWWPRGERAWPWGAAASAEGSLQLDLKQLMDIFDGEGGGAAWLAAWGANVGTAIMPYVNDALAKTKLGDHLSGTKKKDVGFTIANLAKLGGSDLVVQDLVKLANGNGLPSIDTSLAYKLVFELDMRPQGFEISVQMKRVSTLSFGEDERDSALFVQLENATRLIQLKASSQKFKD